MKLTDTQLAQAVAMHDAGISWSIIATFLNVTTNTLRTQLKDYDRTNNQIHQAYEAS